MVLFYVDWTNFIIWALLFCVGLGMGYTKLPHKLMAVIVGILLLAPLYDFLLWWFVGVLYWMPYLILPAVVWWAIMSAVETFFIFGGWYVGRRIRVKLVIRYCKGLISSPFWV